MRGDRRRTRVLVRRGGSPGWSPRVPERRWDRNERDERFREPRESPPRVRVPRRGRRRRERSPLFSPSNRLRRGGPDARARRRRGRVAVELGERRRGSARAGQHAGRLRARAALRGVVRAPLFLPEVAGSSPADASRPRRRGRVAARGVAVFRRRRRVVARRRGEIFPRRCRRCRRFARVRDTHWPGLVVRERRRSRRLVRHPDATRRALLGVSVGNGGEAPRRLRGGVAPRKRVRRRRRRALLLGEQQARRARPGGRPGQGRAHARAGVRVWIRRRRRERFFGRGRKRRRRRRLRRLGRRRVRRRFLFVARASGGRFRASVPGRAERHGLRLGRGPRARDEPFPFPRRERESARVCALGRSGSETRDGAPPSARAQKKKKNATP